jgi:WD40 repeat protein
VLSSFASAAAPPVFTSKGVLEGNTGSVRALSFSSDGRLLLSGDASGRVCVFDVESRRLTANLDTGHGVLEDLAVSPANGLAATTGKDGVVRLWDVVNPAMVRSFHVSEDAVHALAFDPTGGALATGGDDSVLRIHDPDSGVLQAEFKGHEQAIRGVAFIDQGRQLLSCASDKTLRLWDVQSRRETRNQTERSAEYGDLGGLAVSASGGAFVTLLRELKRADGGLRTLGRTGNNVVEQHVLQLRDLSSWADQGRLEGHLRTIARAAFSPDGKWLASVAADQALMIWDRAGRSKVTVFDLPDKQGAVAWSPDGRWLAAGGEDKKVRLYAVRVGTERVVATEPVVAPLVVAWVGMSGEGVTADTAALLGDKVASTLLRMPRFSLVERQNVSKILAEQRLQNLGVIAPESAATLGRMLGAQALAMGRLSKLGESTGVSLTLTDVESGRLLSSVQDKCKCTPEGLLQVVAALAQRLADEVKVPGAQK